MQHRTQRRRRSARAGQVEVHAALAQQPGPLLDEFRFDVRRFGRRLRPFSTDLFTLTEKVLDACTVRHERGKVADAPGLVSADILQLYELGVLVRRDWSGRKTILSTGGGKTIIHLLLFAAHTVADAEGEENDVELHYVRSGLIGFHKQILDEDTVRVPRGPRQNQNVLVGFLAERGPDLFGSSTEDAGSGSASADH